MKVIKVSKEKKKFVVTLHLEDKKLDAVKGIAPDVRLINDFIFESKNQAIEFYSEILNENILVLTDNEQRLSQMPKDSLEQVNNFVDVIKNTKALSKRNSQKIEDLIASHDNMRGFEKNIDEITQKNKEIKEIITAIKRY